jgi:predicted nucleic acid-binding Zn ribbon protein
MKHQYICNACVEKAAGKPVKALTVPDYQQVASQLTVTVEHAINETPQVLCSTCGAVMQKVFGLHSAFVRGYGLLDKKGAKSDMNLYSMTDGTDPYASMRKSSEKTDLITKLRQQKDVTPKTTKVFVKKR